MLAPKDPPFGYRFLELHEIIPPLSRYFNFHDGRWKPSWSAGMKIRESDVGIYICFKNPVEKI